MLTDNCSYAFLWQNTTATQANYLSTNNQMNYYKQKTRRSHLQHFPTEYHKIYFRSLSIQLMYSMASSVVCKWFDYVHLQESAKLVVMPQKLMICKQYSNTIKI